MSVTVTYPRFLAVGESSIEEYSREPLRDMLDDPRGLLLMWSPPDKDHKAKYVIGLDPTVGITGWNRANKHEGDHKTDNGAIEIFEVNAGTIPIFKEIADKDVGRIKIPDIDPLTGKQKRIFYDRQVAEFAAPCDAVEIARIANVLGRIYVGSDEDQCELIYEAWPGPGLLTTQELLRLGYGNLWQWEYIDSLAESTNRPGWRSTPRTQRLLWERSRRHLLSRRAVIKSKYLLAEYSNAQIDPEKQRAVASSGSHDDRMQAANMALWAGHRWTYDPESVHEPVRETRVIEYQQYAPVLGEDYSSYLENRATAFDDIE